MHGPMNVKYVHWLQQQHNRAVQRSGKALLQYVGL